MNECSGGRGASAECPEARGLAGESVERCGGLTHARRGVEVGQVMVCVPRDAIARGTERSGRRSAARTLWCRQGG
jgi:hypothetical protein